MYTLQRSVGTSHDRAHSMHSITWMLCGETGHLDPGGLTGHARGRAEKVVTPRRGHAPLVRGATGAATQPLPGSARAPRDGDAFAAAALETYDLAWALTVHRAQGSQFPAVVAPWSMQYAVMLSRPLLYTAVTRAQRLCVLAGEKRAVATAVGRGEGRRRHSALARRIVESV